MAVKIPTSLKMSLKGRSDSRMGFAIRGFSNMGRLLRNYMNRLVIISEVASGYQWDKRIELFCGSCNQTVGTGILCLQRKDE